MGLDPDQVGKLIVQLNKKVDEVASDVVSLQKGMEETDKEMNSGGYSMKAIASIIKDFEKRISELEKHSKKK